MLRDLAARGIDDVVILDLAPGVGDDPLLQMVVGRWLTDAPQEDARGWVAQRAGILSTGVRVSALDDLAVRVSTVAVQIQEHVLENGHNTLPSCPRHPIHPLWPDERDFENGWPSWRCRTDPSIAFPIGELASAG